MKKILSIGIMLFFSFALILLCSGSSLSEETLSKISEYDILVQLFREFREFQKPNVVDGVPDYTPDAMAKQAEKLESFQKRLESIDMSGLPVSRQVDFHLVRAEMNGLEFNHRVIRPWSRDPGFYCTFPRFEETMRGTVHIPWNLPVPDDKLEDVQRGIRNLPSILAQAKENLTEIAAGMACAATIIAIAPARSTLDAPNATRSGRPGPPNRWPINT